MRKDFARLSAAAQRQRTDDLFRLVNDERRTLHLHGWRKPPPRPGNLARPALASHPRPTARASTNDDWTIRPDREEHEA